MSFGRLIIILLNTKFCKFLNGCNLEQDHLSTMLGFLHVCRVTEDLLSSLLQSFIVRLASAVKSFCQDIQGSEGFEIAIEA